VLRPQFAQQLGVALAAASEAEVAADEHSHDPQRVDQDATHELLGIEGGERAVEREHERGIQPEFAQQLDLALGRHDVLGADLGAQDLQRVAVEGHRDGSGVRRARVLLHPLEHGLVPDVHAVELPDRDHARSEAGGHLVRVAEHDHAIAAFGGCARSHQRPNTGSTSGMNTYPMPKYDHTLSCAKSAGMSKLSAPTMSTPLSSKTMATQATVYQPRRCARIRASVARM